MASGQKTLAEAYPNRFLLGLGVSHIPLVEQLRGHRYEKPVATMRAYLDAMDKAPYSSVPPATKPPRFLRRWVRRCWSFRASERMARILTTSIRSTRRRPEGSWGRSRIYVPSRRWCWKPMRRRRGRSDERSSPLSHAAELRQQLPAAGLRRGDFKDGGSNKLIDAIIAWGDLNAIRNRIREHHSAGADHVCIQVLSANPRSLPLAEWREIAPALLRG